MLSLASRFQVLKGAPLDNENSLIAWWPFDNGDGTDYGGLGQNGNLSGATKPTPIGGQIGGALNFNGTTAYVIGSRVVNTSSVTVSAWLYITAAPGVQGLIAGFANGVGNSTNDKDLYVGADGKLYFYAFSGSGKFTSAPSVTIPLNTWNHVAGTADGTNLRSFLNGVQVGTVACGATFTGYTVPNILASGNTTGAGGATFTFMPQSIDDLRIYGRALSLDEIVALYSQGIAGYALRPDEWEMSILQSAGGVKVPWGLWQARAA